MNAKDIMSSPVITVKPGARANEVTELMRARGIGCVVVIGDDGRMIGLITEGDLAGIRNSIPFSMSLAPVIYGVRAPTEAELRQILAAAAKLTARELMTGEKIFTATESTPVGELLHAMVKSGHKHVPVLRDGKPVGVVARHDLLKLIPAA